jgi:glycine betaine catabolism A
MTTRLIPISAGSTRIDVCFLIREDAVEGVDYDIERVAVWRATSEQDWELCENDHAGIKSSVAYEPGLLSKLTENSVEQFVRWHLAQLGGADSAEHRSSTPECILLG